MKNTSINKENRQKEVEYRTCHICHGTGIVTKGGQRFSAKWNKMSDSAKKTKLAKATSYRCAIQDDTKNKANSHRRPWSKEDEIFICASTLPDEQIAKKLGRSLYSIESKRARLLYNKKMIG